MKHIICLLLFVSILFSLLVGQVKPTPPAPIPPPDTEQPDPMESMDADEVAVKVGDDRPRNFSLVFNRGLMLTGSSPDSVPLNGNSSGTYSIGGGIRIPLIKDAVRLRLTPSISWTHFSYDQTNLKTFPTVADSLPQQLTLEKHTLIFGELPLGVIFNLSRDEDGDPRFFVEAGGYVGYLLGANYKTRFKDSEGLRVKNKRRDLEGIESEFERLRYGLYGRVGYKWAALYFSYRLSDVFDEFTNPSLRPTAFEGYKNPKIPPMEVGISVFF
ncbi:MAG: porin family protein [Bacteroidota bacterium]